MIRWVAMHCGEDTAALQEQNPSAFLLLCQIARRARWKDCPIRGLKYGEALIGDWKKAGLKSEKAYRHAKKILVKLGLAAFVGAGNGTVATLLDQGVFTIAVESGASKRAGDGRPLGGLGATNHTEHPENMDTLRKQDHRVTYSAPAENGASPLSSDAASPARMTEAETQEVALEILKTEAVDSDLVWISLERLKQWAIDWHIKAEQSGWIINGEPIRNARLALRGYLRKAAAGNLDRIKELKGGSSRTATSPDKEWDDEEDDIPF